MKTAVLLVGLPREIGEVWRSCYDNLIQQLPNPDVFIYTGEPYTVEQEFFDTVNPKKYKVEPQFRHGPMEQVLTRIKFHAPEAMNSYTQQIYALKKAWELKEEYERESATKYDLVVRTRTDFIWLRPINLDWLELNKISNLHPNFAPTIAAEFAVGPDHLMWHYCHIYDWLLREGPKWLTPTSHRLDYAHEWNSDSILTVYLYDYCKLTLGKDDGLPREHPSPYDYYRIMRLNKLGVYG